MDHTRRKSRAVFNIACAIAGPVILYLELRSPLRFYYQQNKVFAFLGAACGVFVVVLMIFNRKSQRYWLEWRKALGLACLLRRRQTISEQITFVRGAGGWCSSSRHGSDAVQG